MRRGEIGLGVNNHELESEHPRRPRASTAAWVVGCSATRGTQSLQSKGLEYYLPVGPPEIQDSDGCRPTSMLQQWAP